MKIINIDNNTNQNEEIHYNNIKKTLLFNNNENNLNYLDNFIDEIYNINENQIPNIVHYIYGLAEQKEEFLFIYYISILSNVLVNKPDIIYFHYHKSFLYFLSI